MNTNNNENECPLCYELLSENNSITTRCNHTFHKSCLNKWNKSSCPMCRHKYLDEYAWYSQKQFDNNKDHKKYPYIFYVVRDEYNNQKTVQITEIGTKSMFRDAICLGTAEKFSHVL